MLSYRDAANDVTYGRVLAKGAVVGSLITAPEEDLYSWGRALANGIADAGDGFDGWLARRDANGPSEHGANLDQEWDKRVSYATEGAIAIKHKDPFAAASVVVDLVRDGFVGRKRQEIRTANEELSYDPYFIPIKVEARMLGKVKTWAKDINNGVALSPLGEKYPNTVRAMRVGCMALTIASGTEFIRSANKALDEAWHTT